MTRLHGHAGPVSALAFAPDAPLLLSAAADGAARAWSLEMQRCLAVYRGHALPVWALAACPMGGYFLTGGADRAARLWATEVNARPLRVLAGAAPAAGGGGGPGGEGGGASRARRCGAGRGVAVCARVVV